MVSTRSSAGGTFPIPESYAPGTKDASVDLRNGTFKDTVSTDAAGTGAAKQTDDVSGAMLEPSAFNKNWVRITMLTTLLQHRFGDGVRSTDAPAEVTMCMVAQLTAFIAVRR